MVIKVQYDARNHMFKLVDQEFRTLLEGDALYDLALPLMFEEDFAEVKAICNQALAEAKLLPVPVS